MQHAAGPGSWIEDQRGQQMLRPEVVVAGLTGKIRGAFDGASCFEAIGQRCAGVANVGIELARSGSYGIPGEAQPFNMAAPTPSWNSPTS